MFGSEPFRGYLYEVKNEKNHRTHDYGHCAHNNAPQKDKYRAHNNRGKSLFNVGIKMQIKEMIRNFTGVPEPSPKQTVFLSGGRGVEGANCGHPGAHGSLFTDETAPIVTLRRGKPYKN